MFEKIDLFLRDNVADSDSVVMLILLIGIALVSVGA